MKRLLHIFLAACFFFILTGCKSVQYVPIESVRTEYRDRNLHDSIFIRDSVYVRERGDTVFVDRWRTEYIERLRVDSVCKVDSVPVPYPVEVIKKVEKKLSKWQRLKMDIGGIAIGAIICAIFGAIIFGIKKLKWRC